MARTKDFREAVAATLTAALGISFIDGALSGPVEGRDLGCTFPGGWSPVEENAHYVVHRVGVRVFLAFEAPEPTSPRDPSELEDLSEAIAEALTRTAAPALQGYLYEVASADILHDLQGVEVVVAVQLRNPFGG